MSEAVREMTREELCLEIKVLSEQKAYLENVTDSMRERGKGKDKRITEMQSHIDCLKAELAEVQQNKPEPPAEPIKVADWLIDRHMEHAGEFERHFAAENAGKIVAGSPVEKFRQAQVVKIRQIAEHLLTYCNHAEVE